MGSEIRQQVPGPGQPVPATPRLPPITIGTPVTFLPSGDFNKARPGQVDGIGVKGTFDVVYYAAGGGRQVLQRGTSHHLHPRYAEDPASASRVGMFYTLGEFEAERQRRLNEERSRVQQKHDQQQRLLRERVIDMAEQGLPTQEIAAHAEIGAPMVEEILHEWRTGQQQGSVQKVVPQLP